MFFLGCGLGRVQNSQFLQASASCRNDHIWPLVLWVTRWHTQSALGKVMRWMPGRPLKKWDFSIFSSAETGEISRPREWRTKMEDWMELKIWKDCQKDGSLNATGRINYLVENSSDLRWVVFCSIDLPLQCLMNVLLWWQQMQRSGCTTPLYLQISRRLRCLKDSFSRNFIAKSFDLVLPALQSGL